MNYINELIDFISSSPTCFQVAENAASLLREAGFEELDYGGNWELQPKGSYFTRRNMSSLIAFRIPEEGLAPFALVESHSDSPCFRIKINCDVPSAGKYTVLNTEIYGGAINYTWFDRPLTAAGRISYRTADGVASKSVYIDRPLFVIPSVAPHLNREANNGFKPLANVDLLPLSGGPDSEGKLKTMIASEAGVSVEDILLWDLYAVNCDKGYVFGTSGEFFSSPRIDNQSNVFASVRALIGCSPRGMIPVASVFNREEIGSYGIDGADSRVLADVLESIADSLGADSRAYRRMLKSSFAISADNGHAVHPNHPEMADAKDRCYLNGGIMIKQSPAYTTDGFSGAVFAELCHRAGLDVQVYSNRADQRGGSTLGVISISQISVPTVDIGIPQLAMHSANETAGCMDPEDMEKALTCFFSSTLRSDCDSQFRIL